MPIAEPAMTTVFYELVRQVLSWDGLECAIRRSSSRAFQNLPDDLDSRPHAEIMALLSVDVQDQPAMQCPQTKSLPPCCLVHCRLYQ
jgi:hypothetical protein